MIPKPTEWGKIDCKEKINPEEVKKGEGKRHDGSIVVI